MINVNLTDDLVCVAGYYFGTVALHRTLLQRGVPHQYSGSVTSMSIETALAHLGGALNDKAAILPTGFRPAARLSHQARI
jgi:hypothetical protein